MLIPYLGETGAALAALAFVVASLVAFVGFVWWTRKPYRDMVKEIKKRPSMLVRLPDGKAIWMDHPCSWPTETK